jgi:branched-chain amino acid transport system ATP-binding protein
LLKAKGSAEKNMLLSIDDVTMEFGGLKALDGVSLNIKEGIIKGLIGPNGSGKTTLFNILSGFYIPTSGRLTLNDQEITNEKPYALARRGISRTFQSTLLFNERTVLENILIATYCNRRDTWVYPFLTEKRFKQRESGDRAFAEEILKMVTIHEYRNELVKNIPFGIRHFLEIGRCIAVKPKLILLDEPTTGLNPAEQKAIVEVIKAIRGSGITVFIVEHNMKVIMNNCDEISVLDHGKKIAEGTPEEVRNNPAVIQSYLGKGTAYAKY